MKKTSKQSKQNKTTSKDSGASLICDWSEEFEPVVKMITLFLKSYLKSAQKKHLSQKQKDAVKIFIQDLPRFIRRHLEEIFTETTPSGNAGPSHTDTNTSSEQKARQKTRRKAQPQVTPKSQGKSQPLANKKNSTHKKSSPKNNQKKTSLKTPSKAPATKASQAKKKVAPKPKTKKKVAGTSAKGTSKKPVS